MRIFQITGLLLIIVVISSCAIPNYQHIFESSKVLDFRSGKWLVNNIEADLPWKSKKALTDNLLKELNDFRGDSVYFIDNILFKYIVPSRFQFDMSLEVLELLNSTTDFDYLISIKAIKNRNELSDIMLSSPMTYSKSESEVWIVVYEIKSGFKIYSHRIIASVALGGNDDDIIFAKSAHSLVFDALRKGLKKIKKNSIRN